MNNPRPSILPACIIAAGLIIAAVIIANPKLPLHLASIFPPTSRESVRRQFTAQMQSQLAGRQITNAFDEKVTLSSVIVDTVRYNARRKEYSILYTLKWNSRSGAAFGAACTLRSGSANSFSGDCGIGEEHVRNGLTHTETVPISIE